MCNYALSFIFALQSPYWLLHPPGPHGSRVLKKQALRLKAPNVFTFIYVISCVCVCAFVCVCACVSVVPIACLVVTGASRGHHRLCMELEV